MDMQRIEPNRPITVQLTPEQWNVVLFALRNHALPFEVSAPILNALTEQFRQQAQSQRPLSTEDMAGQIVPGT